MEKREIKIKALYEGKLYPIMALWDENRMVRIATKDFSMLDCAAEALVQYSGVNDKDGKEIYEKDVVKCEYGWGIVEFHSGAFMIVWQDDKEANMEFLAIRDYASGRLRDDIELLGSSLENPELLTNH